MVTRRAWPSAVPRYGAGATLITSAVTAVPKKDLKPQPVLPGELHPPRWPTLGDGVGGCRSVRFVRRRLFQDPIHLHGTHVRARTCQPGYVIRQDVGDPHQMDGWSPRGNT